MTFQPPRIKIDDFTIYLLTDGLWRNDGGCMFGVVPRVLWEREHPADSMNRIRLNLTCPLLIHGSEAILIDTGIGNRLEPRERQAYDHGEGWLPEGLRTIGMEPCDITHVALSHLHFDHCGGLVRRHDSGRFTPAFPRARILVQQSELELARNTSNRRLRAAYRHVDDCLGSLEGRIETVSGTIRLMDGVELLITGGHTPGHQILKVQTPGGGFLHLADIVPTRSHMRPGWNQAYDLDPLRTDEEKDSLLVTAASQQWWISFAHDPKLLAARIGREPTGKLSVRETLDMPGKAD